MCIRMFVKCAYWLEWQSRKTFLVAQTMAYFSICAQHGHPHTPSRTKLPEYIAVYEYNDTLTETLCTSRFEFRAEYNGTSRTHFVHTYTPHTTTFIQTTLQKSQYIVCVTHVVRHGNPFRIALLWLIRQCTPVAFLGYFVTNIFIRCRDAQRMFYKLNIKAHHICHMRTRDFLSKVKATILLISVVHLCQKVCRVNNCIRKIL